METLSLKSQSLGTSDSSNNTQLTRGGARIFPARRGGEEPRGEVVYVKFRLEGGQQVQKKFHGEKMSKKKLRGKKYIFSGVGLRPPPVTIKIRPAID